MKKKINFIFKDKKIYKFFLYLLTFFIASFFVYLFLPKFFNYTPNLIKKSLYKNSNININDISKIIYNPFPSPRLRLSGSNLDFGGNILEIKDAEIDIILNPLNIIKYKDLDYNKFLIREGSANIEIKKINQLFNYIKNNEKKINFKKNNIILFKENKKLFDISNSLTKINTQQLSINGLFLNHKISFTLKNISDTKTKIALKIPGLDMSANILLETKDNYKTYEGLVNIEVLNNFFQFNLIKQKNIKIKKGFIRSNLTNTIFKGELSFKPYFSFNLDIEPSTLNVEKLIFIIQKNYFLGNLKNSEIMKKIDGSLNFKNMLEGSIIFKNREVFFENFKIGKENKIIFDANISEFGPKGKIQFNFIVDIQNKKNTPRELKISGNIVPSSSRVVFKKIIFNEEIFSEKKIKKYEKKFKKDVVNGSLKNIFNEDKIGHFFKSF